MQPITLANIILFVSVPLALANPVGETVSAIFDRQINCWKANCGGAGECAGSWVCSSLTPEKGCGLMLIIDFIVLRSLAGS